MSAITNLMNLTNRYPKDKSLCKCLIELKVLVDKSLVSEEGLIEVGNHIISTLAACFNYSPEKIHSIGKDAIERAVKFYETDEIRWMYLKKMNTLIEAVSLNTIDLNILTIESILIDMLNLNIVHFTLKDKISSINQN